MASGAAAVGREEAEVSTFARAAGVSRPLVTAGRVAVEDGVVAARKLLA